MDAIVARLADSDGSVATKAADTLLVVATSPAVGGPGGGAAGGAADGAATEEVAMEVEGGSDGLGATDLAGSSAEASTSETSEPSASGGADDSVTRPVQVLSWVLRFSRMEPVASDSTLLLRMAESMGRLSVVSGEWCGEDTATTSTEFHLLPSTSGASSYCSVSCACSDALNTPLHEVYSPSTIHHPPSTIHHPPLIVILVHALHHHHHPITHHPQRRCGSKRSTWVPWICLTPSLRPTICSCS